MRIHQKIKIARSNNIPHRNNYHDYLPDLVEDFHHICGYCGKSETVSQNGFEIDHFVPIKIDSERETDYSNLVYSCYICNRKKSKKWPTGDKSCPNNGCNGFVDPATDEYDLHLGRREDGSIEPYTTVGEYICEKGLCFNIRPMKEIWQAMKLIEAKEILAASLDKLTTNELKLYIIIDKELSEFMKSFTKRRE